MDNIVCTAPEVARVGPIVPDSEGPECVVGLSILFEVVKGNASEDIAESELGFAELGISFCTLVDGTIRVEQNDNPLGKVFENVSTALVKPEISQQKA